MQPVKQCTQHRTERPDDYIWLRGIFKLRSLGKTIITFPNEFRILYLHCIFQSTKLKSLWIFKFDSAPCWAVVLIKKISLPLYLSIGTFLVNGLLKRRYHVYLYFLLCICVGFLSKRSLSSSLFSDLVVPPPRQCIPREAFKWKSFCKSIVTIFFFIIIIFLFFSRSILMVFLLRRRLNPFLISDLAGQPANHCTPAQNLMSSKLHFSLEYF